MEFNNDDRSIVYACIVDLVDTRMRRRARVSRELKNHDEVHDDDVCWLGKDWNENVSFGGKKET